MVVKNIKEIIAHDYSLIAQKAEREGSDAQRKTICKPIYDAIDEPYKTCVGYQPDADLGLGCAFPFQYAQLIKGAIVLDLGCAAGIDAFIMREMVGDTGFIYGLDITNSLILRAQKIAFENQFKNMQFMQGDIENIPLQNNSIHTMTSNGVFSLLPDKQKAFHDMFRVLKPKGNFCIADITAKGIISTESATDMLNFTGCLNGIALQQDYIYAIENAGFSEIEIVHERRVELPENISKKLLHKSHYMQNKTGLYISVITAHKK
jgi:arsenite methyltransferase